MRFTHKLVLAAATSALLAGSAGPAFADDPPPPPPIPEHCFDEAGALLSPPPEGCPDGRQASGH